MVIMTRSRTKRKREEEQDAAGRVNGSGGGHLKRTIVEESGAQSSHIKWKKRLVDNGASCDSLSSSHSRKKLEGTSAGRTDSGSTDSLQESKRNRRTKRKGINIEVETTGDDDGGCGQLKKTIVVEGLRLRAFPTNSSSEPVKSPRATSVPRNEDEKAESVHFHRETIHLLNLFPEEVWDLILEEVRGSEDMESLSNASPFFRYLLGDRRVVFLFPKVIMLVGDMLLVSMKAEFRQRKTTETTSAVASVQRCLACDGERQQRWYSEFLKLRLVCSAWCSGVVQFCQRELQWFYLPVMIPTRSYFHADAQIQRFLKHFRNSHKETVAAEVHRGRSPFLDGFVTVRLDDIETAPIRSLFSLYGHHIVYCDIHGIKISTERGYRGRLEVSYAEIRNCLQLMPKLKRLDMFTWCNDSVEAQIKREIRLFPLPTIQSLKFLRINWKSSLFYELIQKNSQLTSLQVDNDSLCGESHQRLCSLPSFNLKQFKAQYGRVEEFAMLEKVKWSLEKLDLDLRKEDYFDRSKLFSVLGNKAWAESLTVVNLRLNFRYPDETAAKNGILREFSELRLPLPRVKHFGLYMNYYRSHDFLLSMKETLESLRIVIDIRYDWKWQDELMDAAAKKQVIQFIGYSNELYKSNIWTLFPKLQNVKCLVIGAESKNKENSYTRHMWEYQKRVGEGQ